MQAVCLHIVSSLSLNLGDGQCGSCPRGTLPRHRSRPGMSSGPWFSSVSTARRRCGPEGAALVPAQWGNPRNSSSIPPDHVLPRQSSSMTSSHTCPTMPFTSFLGVPWIWNPKPPTLALSVMERAPHTSTGVQRDDFLAKQPMEIAFMKITVTEKNLKLPWERAISVHFACRGESRITGGQRADCRRQPLKWSHDSTSL